MITSKTFWDHLKPNLPTVVTIITGFFYIAHQSDVKYIEYTGKIDQIIVTQDKQGAKQDKTDVKVDSLSIKVDRMQMEIDFRNKLEDAEKSRQHESGRVTERRMPNGSIAFITAK